VGIEPTTRGLTARCCAISASNPSVHRAGVEPANRASEAQRRAVGRCRVKVEGLEPPASRSQAERSTKLSYTLNQSGRQESNLRFRASDARGHSTWPTSRYSGRAFGGI
jgi:hypothetical protein